MPVIKGKNKFRHGYGLNDIPPSIWLYLPIILVLAQFILAGLLDHEAYRGLVGGELGLIENLTVLFVAIAIITGCRIWFIRSHFPAKEYNIFIILIIIGCIYILGEEISWGQHYFRWETVEWLSDINKQKETNLHNIHNIFGVVPKIILEWTIYITGIFFTLGFRLKNTVFDPVKDWQYFIFPTFIIFPSAILAFIFRIFDRMENWFDMDHVIDWDETHECLLGFIIMIYLLSIHKRLREKNIYTAT